MTSVLYHRISDDRSSIFCPKASPAKAFTGGPFPSADFRIVGRGKPASDPLAGHLYWRNDVGGHRPATRG